MLCEMNLFNNLTSNLTKLFFFHYQLTTLLNIYYAFSLVVAIVDLETG